MIFAVTIDLLPNDLTIIPDISERRAVGLNGENFGLPNIFAAGFIHLPIQTWPGLEKHHRVISRRSSNQATAKTFGSVKKHFVLLLTIAV